MTTLSAKESMGTIDKFIQEVGATEKAAQDKQATALSEPGSQGGETSHPVKNVDDRLEVAKEGERSSENEADVKEDQGNPGVDSTPEAKAGSDGGAVQTPGSAADDHLQIGTNTQATGDDPSTETNSAKAGKEDPGSSHPARTDNDQLDGHKYSADQLAQMDLGQIAKIAADLGNDLCASLAVEDPNASAASQAQPSKQAADNGQPENAALAHQAGWELAGLLTGDFDKEAADSLVEGTLQETIKVAADDADRVVRFLGAYEQGTQEKQAMGEEGMPPEMMGGEPPAPEGGGMPMGEGGGEEDMMAALGGGDPAAEDPMGGEMGGEMGGGDEEAEELAMILEELGVTPEELEAAMAAEEGGGLEEGGGEGMEVEASDRRGSTKTAAVKKGNTNAGVRDYVKEVISRSRRA
jgi:hypothetical protein